MNMKKNLKAAALIVMLVTVAPANAGLISVVTDTMNCYKVDGPRHTAAGNPSGTIDMCIGDGFATYNISSDENMDTVLLPIFNEFNLEDLDLVTSNGLWSAITSNFGQNYLNLTVGANQDLYNITFELRANDFNFNFGDVIPAAIFGVNNSNSLYNLPTLGYTSKQQTPVPEPSTLGLFLLGAGFAYSRREKLVKDNSNA